MTRRLVYATAMLGVLLVAFWATAPSETSQDDSSGTIKLEAPKALAQSSNFPVDYAGIALYVKYEPTDFSNIHAATTKVAANVKDTDGASYVWVETLPRENSPVFDLYADTSGWLVVFLPKSTVDDWANRSSVAYMLFPGDLITYRSSVIEATEYPGPLWTTGYSNSLGYPAAVALLQFTDAIPGWYYGEIEQNTRFYHFEYPQATAIHVAVKYWDSMSFFIPEALTVEEASFAFWTLEEQREHFLSIYGPTHGSSFLHDVENDPRWDQQRLIYGYLGPGLEKGRHEVEVFGNVMLAITVRE